MISFFRYTVFFLFICGNQIAQNEPTKWYFGYGAGLDFMTTPPSPVVSHPMNSSEGCGSIADGFGNLLFYTDGLTIWNKNHLVMANGTGLLGNASATQSGLILKQPGNTNLYYVFTLDEIGGQNGMRYSVVDMDLDGGQGAVTIKNVLLYTPTTEKLAASWHCNGKDIWIISHEWNSNNFISHILTSSGISPTPTVSSVGAIHTGGGTAAIGQMKVSPNAKKLGVVTNGLGLIEMFDFNSTSGVVSNCIVVDSSLNYPYGCEFSSDGSKFYVRTSVNGAAALSSLYQFDICNTGATSRTLLIEPATMMCLQLAPNGKIYVAVNGSQSAGVINNPDAIGMASNFVLSGQTVATDPGKKLTNTFPGFISGYFKQSFITPFTFTTNCQQVSFDAKAGLFTNPGNCSARYAMSSMSWNFGDPASGSSNVSSVSNPVHTFSGPGTYTVQLVRVFPCNPDTLRQVVTVSALSPTFAITGPGTACRHDVNTLNTNQANYQYSWKMAHTALGAPIFTAQGHSVVVSPSVTAFYTVTATDTTTGCSVSKLHILSVNTCLGDDERHAKAQAINIYPNPASDFLNIQSKYKNLQIEIFDATGTQVLSNYSTQENYQMDIRFLPQGIYFVHVKNETVNVVQKVMKRE